MKLENLSLNQLNDQERQLLLNGLCRYPETKIINAQLFLHILSYYNKNAANIDSSDSSDCLRDAMLYAKTMYPEILYVFDLLQIRLLSVIKDVSAMNRNISKDELCDFLARIDVKLSAHDMRKLLDILARAACVIDELINMKQLWKLITYFTQYSNRAPAVESERDHSLTTYPYNPRVYSNILNQIQNQADLIMQEIRRSNRSEFVSKEDFQVALQKAGIALTQHDVAGLWYYMFESKDSVNVAKVKQADLAAMLSPTSSQIANSGDVFSSMNQALPYPRTRRGSSSSSRNMTPYAIDMVKPSPLPPQPPRSMPPAKAEVKSTSRDYTSNLCRRISSRVANMADDQRDKFIAAVIAFDPKTFSRSNVAKILSDYNIKALHADCDEIWSDVTCSPLANKLIAFLDWLGITPEIYQAHLSKKSTDSQSHHKQDRPDAVFQYVHRQPERCASPPRASLEAANDNPWVFHPSMARMEDLAKDEKPGIRVSSSRTVMDQPPLDPQPVRSSLDSDEMSKLLTIDEAAVIDEEEAESRRQREQRLKAVFALQRNRANLAFIFRKLLGKDGRLDDNSLACQRLADALIQPPISLQLTPIEAYRLVCDMTNTAYDYDTTFSSTKRIYFRDVLSFLDRQPSTRSSGSPSKLPEADTYRNNFMRYSIKSKLYDSFEVLGDRLKLLALVPRLKSRHRSLLARGRQASWETTVPDLCSLLHLKELLHSIDVKVDSEEVKFILDDVRQRHKDSYSTEGIGDFGVKLGDAILLLCDILE
jgi:hypothetical protein